MQRKFWRWWEKGRSTQSRAVRGTRLQVEPLEDRVNPSDFNVFALGTGPGSVPRVQVFSTLSGAVFSDFVAFEPTFLGGISVAMGDINADGAPDVIVGAGSGGGPRVRVFNGAVILQTGFAFNPTIAGAVLADFFVYEPSFRGGVQVATGNFLGNVGGTGGFDDLVIGSGLGGGPRVRILNGESIAFQGLGYTSLLIGDAIADFFAFEFTFRDGVNVAAGETFGRFSTLATAPGFGGAPRVRIFDGAQIAAQTLTFTGLGPLDRIADFFAFNPILRGGASVASADVDTDGFPDVIVGPGPGTTGNVTVFSGRAFNTQRLNFTGNLTGDVIDSFIATNFPNFITGVSVGSSLVNGGGDLVLVGVGGQGLLGQASAFRYQFTPTGFARTLAFTLTFDPNFLGPVRVSN